jgi:alpha-glucosidase (family GH31 glycosyl hydrolase)
LIGGAVLLRGPLVACRRRITALWSSARRIASAGALSIVTLAAALADPTVVEVAQRGEVLRLATPDAVAEVRLRRYRLRWRSAHDGKTLAREVRTGSLFYERGEQLVGVDGVTAVAALPDGADLTVDTGEGLPATVRLRFPTSRTLEVVFEPPAAATVTAVGDRWRSPRSEAIYGLTERLRDSPPLSPGIVDIPEDDIRPPEAGSLDRRGETVEMRILPTFSLYAPFYQSSRGYGLAVAGTTFGVFDVARSDPRAVSFRFETGSDPASRRLVFRLFAGPEHATILDEYTRSTGRPFVPPDWAFRHWRWRDELPSGPTALLDGTPINADVADDVLMYEALGIPAGVYLFDRPVLQGNYGFARWAWDESRLPNVEAMLGSLRARGYELAIWSATWMCGSAPGDNGLEAQALGHLAPGPAGAPNCADVGGTSFILDATRPAAQAWWRDRIAAFVETYGIRGIKLDRGEEHIPSEAGDVWADGRTGREVRNDYPTLQARIHHEALRLAFGDGFVLLSRPGYAGTQRFAVFWGGDIPGSESFGAGPGTDLGLRSAIISQQRAAFMGFPVWGSDTGGYYEFKDREVFARWIEFSAFSGIMEIGGRGERAPWRMPTTPAYDDELIDIYRRYTRLRETLLPYVVAAGRAAESGLPIVRPMPFADRTDRRLRDLWDQYLFGPDLLVAPVWRVGQRSREVYLPRGEWLSYWEPGQTYKGRRRIAVDAPLDTIPVFVRAGAAVPGP